MKGEKREGDIAGNKIDCKQDCGKDTVGSQKYMNIT